MHLVRREDGAALGLLLSRMCLPAAATGARVAVRVPPTRHDVIHACDLYEDVAIAYGWLSIYVFRSHSNEHCSFHFDGHYIHTYHSRFIPEWVAEASQKFLRNTHVLPTLFSYE
jgi:hypothetical protein